MSLFETIGRNNPSFLLEDPQGADAIAIPCEPGNGIVPRGTLMYRKASGMYAPAASGNVTAENQLVVLDESVNTNESMTIAEDARAYRAARLIDGKVTLANGGALTAAHKVVLRMQNLVFSHMMETAPETANGKAEITYKANGGTGSDVVAYADLGSSYAIAANTFTPPTSKNFSKWNTAADGSGTDYAAAASYTANDDLTLYAIWA